MLPVMVLTFGSRSCISINISNIMDLPFIEVGLEVGRYRSF